MDEAVGTENLVAFPNTATPRRCSSERGASRRLFRRVTQSYAWGNAIDYTPWSRFAIEATKSGL